MHAKQWHKTKWVNFDSQPTESQGTRLAKPKILVISLFALLTYKNETSNTPATQNLRWLLWWFSKILLNLCHPKCLAPLALGAQDEDWLGSVHLITSFRRRQILIARKLRLHKLPESDCQHTNNSSKEFWCWLSKNFWQASSGKPTELFIVLREQSFMISDHKHLIKCSWIRIEQLS